MEPTGIEPVASLLAKQHSRSVGRAPFLGLCEEFASIGPGAEGPD